MAKEFSLSIVAPDRAVIDDEPVTSVIVPGIEGYIGVLAGHAPVIAALKPGLLEYVDARDQRNFVAVSGGFAEVANDKVTVLADTAERSKDIDLSRAEQALENARRALRGEGDAGMTSEQ